MTEKVKSIYQNSKDYLFYISYVDGSKSKGFETPRELFVDLCIQIVTEHKTKAQVKRLVARGIVDRAIKKCPDLYKFSFTMDEKEFWQEYVDQMIVRAILMDPSGLSDIMMHRVVGPAKDLFTQDALMGYLNGKEI